MQKLLIVILLFSLSVNAYLLMSLRNSESTLRVTQNNGVSQNEGQPYRHTEEFGSEGLQTPNSAITRSSISTDDEALKFQISKANERPQEMTALEFLELLKTLQKKQQYDDLTLPLREYLSRYPSDYEAWLIEADLILHTEPLSTAIAFYYDLLEKNLPANEEDKVRTIIQVNTSKVIQQLSGDTAWDLLATFIEPLLQIDPLNPRYILGLAKAYGKQGQVTLMENALAALPYDDPRAEQLRKAIYSPSTTPLPDETPFDGTETASVSKRKIPVLGNGQQFFVQTKIDRTSHLFLIDTGASTTAISNRVFTRLPSSDKEFIGRFNVQTAGGSIEAPLYKLNAITLGDITINNVSVIVLPDESFRSNFQGLLGMNVLRNFDLQFDPENQKMSLFER
jgi:clan AA aspartic protease (TIGR02281 family)